jgi:anaerobic magnesium-protoporphyrin IX monomethyl ester cyclase
MSLRLLLIAPAHLERFNYGQPKYYAENMAVFPPLSLLPLVSYLRKMSGHTVKVIDMAIERMGLEELRQEINSFQPQVVGVTCMINRWYTAVTILREIKRINPVITTVVGGFNVSEFPEETISHDCVDFIVLGSGQQPLKELLDILESQGQGFDQVKGLFARRSQKRNFVEEKQKLDPDLFPFPDRTCVPYKKYHSAISFRFPSTVMISSEGCPYSCNFCNTSCMKIIIIRDPIKVVDEMEECCRIGIREIMFQDELFTIQKNRVIRICEEIHKRRLDVVWNFKSRIDLIDESILRPLKGAGCTHIHFGVENGNDEILEKMNKGITTAQVKKTFLLLKKYHIDASASFMLAYPGETLEQVRRTIDFAIEIDPVYAQFTITCDFPGTKIYQENLKNNRYKEDIWKSFVLDPREDFVVPYSSDLFSREELENILHDAYRRFYRRPAYVRKKLFSIRNLQQLWNQSMIAKDILFSRA